MESEVNNNANIESTPGIDNPMAPKKGSEENVLSRRNKILTTCAIFYGNATYGCAMNAFSPALTDFKRKFDTDTETVSIVFTASLLCYMAGALCCTFIYNIINRQFVVVVLFVGIAAAMFVSPFIPKISLFYFVGGLLGFCIGCYDSAQFVWIMEMWQSASGPFIQAQHFFFAIGTVISPLIMSPFLTEVDEDEDDDNNEDKKESDRLFVPFTILGILCAITAVAQMALFLFMRYRPPPPEVTPETVQSSEDRIKEKELEASNKNWFQKQWPGWGVARLVIFSGLTLGFYQGMEIATMQMLPTFGQKSDHELSESTSADTLTGLTAAFAFGRGLAIILIFKIRAEAILYVNIMLCLVGNVIMIGWGNAHLWALWAASILYGLGFSSLLPSCCAYMERYLVFTNTIGAMMIVCGSFVGAMYPLIIGSSIDDNPMIMTYPIFVSIGVMSISCFVLYRLTGNTLVRSVR